MTYRSESINHHNDHGSNSNHFNGEHRPNFRHENSSNFSASLSLNIYDRNNANNVENNTPNFYDHKITGYSAPAYNDRATTNYYDRDTVNNYERNLGTNNGNCNDIATQGALDAWAPRKVVAANDYHDPNTFNNPYDDLKSAVNILHSSGLDAARSTYMRSIDEADGISVRDIRNDRRYDMQNLTNINATENTMVRNGASMQDLRDLEQQRQQIINNEKQLNNLYYAPANTRISMGLACIKTGDSMEMLEGERLIEDAKRKRPEIANDPKLQNMIDNAYQVGYRNHANHETPAPGYEFHPPSVYHAHPRNEYPQHANPVYPPETQVVPRPSVQPWTPAYTPTPSDAPARTNVPPTQSDVPARTNVPPRNDVPTAPTSVRTDAPLTAAPVDLPPARPHSEIPAPPGVPVDGSSPTAALVENTQSRISDQEVTGWLQQKYQHLTVEQLMQNQRDAQKAYDETPSEFSFFGSTWSRRAEERKQAKTVEYSNGFRADLDGLKSLAKEAPSHDSDYARQALVTIIKNSAQNMSIERLNREISEECCQVVRDLCKPGANGRAQMVDAIRVGLTESSHLTGGGKAALLDGLELLATEKPPAISAETAGRLALIALKHELDNTPRIGAEDRTGDSRGEGVEREVRLINMLNKFGYKDSLADLHAVQTSSANDAVRKAASIAIISLEQ